MHLLAAILNINQIGRINLFPHYLNYVPVIKLFGVPSIFVLKFFGEVLLLFLASALISYVLKIDRASEE